VLLSRFAAIATIAALTPIAAAVASTPAAQKPPSATQIRAAIDKAKVSPNMWATVNICDTAQHPDQLGIRGQVPGLGFKTHVFMTIDVQYYVAAAGRFEDSGASQLVDLGTLTKGVQQAGYTFPFKAPAQGQSYNLRGAITVRWKIGSKTVGSAVVHTKHGYPNVRFGDPPGYSAGTCSIPNSATSTPPAGTATTPAAAR